MFYGIPKSLSLSGTGYREFVIGKQSKTSFGKRTGKRAQEILEMVHTDLCGQMNVEYLGVAKYFITFINDKTRKTFISLNTKMKL